MTRTKKAPARKNSKPSKKAVRTTTKVVIKDAAASPKQGTANAAPAQEPKAAPTPKAPKVRDPRLPSPGTIMVRKYKDKSYKLKYLADGIEVDGKHFDSLSAAARHVSGAASINGFLFFNLTDSPTRKAKSAETVAPKAAKPVEPKIGGDTNEVATPAGQRAALAAAGLVRKGRPISKPRGAFTAKGE